MLKYMFRVSLLLLFLLVNKARSYDDRRCNTVHFLGDNVVRRCCRVCHADYENKIVPRGTEVITTRINGQLFKCESVRGAEVGGALPPKPSEGGVSKGGVIIGNRNLGDAPDRCPDDMVMDEAGNCNEVWD